MSFSASLNHIYRTVWNQALGVMVAVAEISPNRASKAGASAAPALLRPNAPVQPPGGLSLLALSLVFASLPSWALDAGALPTGAQVVAGSAAISQTSNVLTVQQNSQRAALNWQSFNIGSAATVNFNQPSANAVALNRISGNEASQIFGKLNANGQVFFSNPYGMLFAPGSQVNVGGILATTLDMNNDDFMAGNYRLTNPGSGSIRNEGLINALGSIALLGKDVHNSGQLVATTITLAAGNTVAVDLTGDGLIRARVEDTALAASIENSGSIAATTAVTLTAGQAQQALDSVVNNSGTIKATGLSMQGGEIVLLGGTTLNAGNLDASSAQGQGGNIKLLGTHVGVTGQASIDASGATGGGTVLVGGDYQGKNPDVPNAQYTYFGPEASIQANATVQGDGGKVILWADQSTRAHGSIEAKGGPDGGNGGLVETSAHHLDVTGIKVNAQAPKGAVGTWLLDPIDVTIINGESSVLPGGGIFAPLENTSISDSEINNALIIGTSVDIRTTADGAGNGDIFVEGFISDSSLTSPASLTFNAFRDIVFVDTGLGPGNITITGDFVANAGQNVTVPSGSYVRGRNVTINAGLSGPGNINITGGGEDAIRAEGGQVILRAGVDPSDNSSLSGSSASAILFAGGGASVSTDGGNISMWANGGIAVVGDIYSSGGKVTMKTFGTGDILVGAIDTQSIVPGSSGGDINLQSSGGLIALDGSLNASGGNGSGGGGAAGTVTVQASVDITGQGEGQIEAVGGSSDGGVGGQGGAISLKAGLGAGDADGYGGNVNLSAYSVNASGGNGFTGGGAAGAVLVRASYDILGGSGYGGSINIGSVSARGGTANQSGLGGQGANITLSAEGGAYGGAVTLGTFGNLDASGGNGVDGGGDAGSVSVTAVDAVSAGAGGGSIFANGGNGGVGNGGDITLSVTSGTVGAVSDLSLYAGGSTNGVVTVKATAGNLEVGGLNAPDTPILVQALQGAITGVGAGPHITANNLDIDLQARDGIGALNADIVVSNASLQPPASLSFSNTNIGVYIKTIGEPLVIKSGSNTNGDIYLSAVNSTIELDPDIILTAGGALYLDPLSAITAQGASTLKAGGNLTLGSLSSPTFPVTLVSGGTLSLGGISAEGRWLIYLTDPNPLPLHEFGTLGTPNFIEYNNTFGGPTAVGGPTPDPIANGVIFSSDSLLFQTGTLTGSVLKTYDGSTAISLSGAFLNGASLDGQSGSLDSKNVGSAKIVTVSSSGGVGVETLWLGQDVPEIPVYGIRIDASGPIGTVTPAGLSASGVTVASKVYDGTTLANVTGGTLSGVISGDSVSLGNLTGSFADKNVGTGKTVSVSGLSLSGADSSNYTLSAGSSSLTADITPLQLSLSNLSKVYDGTTLGDFTSGTLTGVITSDIVTLGSLTGSFADKNVGTGKTLSIASASLLGTDKGNYTLPASASANITQRPVATWSGLGGNNAWSNPANWDALPDLSNVAAVSIPTGTTVVYDGAAGSTNLSSLTAGALTISGGQLSVSGNLQTNALRLNAGTVTGTGNLTSADFAQTGGTLGSSFANLNLGSLGDFFLSSSLSATQSISLTSSAAISSAGQSVVLTAPSVVLDAGTGVGSLATPLQLNTQALLATTGSGGMYLVNSPTGAVSLRGLSTGNASNLSYSQNGQALNVLGNITSGGGDILIDPPTDLTMSPSATVSTATGNIDLQASGNVLLATVSAPTGNVAVSTTGGSIGSATPGVNNVTANKLTLAATGDVQLAYLANTVDTSGVGGSATLSTTASSSLITNAAVSVISSVQSLTDLASAGDTSTNIITITTSNNSVPEAETAPIASVDLANTDDQSLEKAAEKTVAPDNLMIVMGDSIIEKPVAEIVLVDKPAGSQLVCR